MLHLEQIEIDWAKYPFLDRSILQVSELITSVLTVGQDSLEVVIQANNWEYPQLNNVLAKITRKVEKNWNYFLGELVKDLRKEDISEEQINLILLELWLPEEYLSNYDNQTKLVLTIKS